jgi:ketosteroid isomerase-like protein
MTTPVSRKLVQDYFDAQLSRNPARLVPLLHDDVEWSIAGPVDLLHFCGERHGKAAMIETIVKRIPALLQVQTYAFDEILIDGDRAATFMRLSAIHTATGRTVSYRCAQFLRFSDGKLIEFRALIDSFDAAEQVLGHPIEVAPAETQRIGGVFAI